MTRERVWSVAVACVLVMPSFTLAQTVCGDANQDGTKTLLDVVFVGTYVLNGPDVGPPIAASADCDNRSGITISDAEALIRYLFFSDDRLDCVIGDSYGFSPSLADTVFLPFMTSLPDGLDSVKLPVITSLAVETRAFYIPCRGYEINGPGRFGLTRIDEEEHLNWGASTTVSTDTAVLTGYESSGPSQDLTGRHTYFNLVFKRNQPGLADITCTDVVRSTTLRMAVEKDGDLFTPVVLYYEVPLPHPVVTATPASLNMVSQAGYWSKTSFDVMFTSDGANVSFDLGVTDDWIVIENPSPTGYTTPTTITVRANSSSLPPGDYQGQITISNADPEDAEFIPSTIDVALVVTEPLTIPPGDLNCDGIVSLSDVMLLIDCLFINARPVPSCE